MRINLGDIPQDGKEFICNQNTGEFNETLADLIGKNPYDVKFHIQPIQKGFELRGSVRTNLPELCSRCGDDMKVNINTSYHGILLPRLELGRSGHYAKSNHVSETSDNDEASLIEFDGQHFDMAEYLHEIVALEIPFKPVPPEDEKGNCSLCHLNLKTHTFGYSDPELPKKESPFAALKNIKIN